MMKTIMGTVRNGQIVTDQPIEWPDGYRVIIKPAVEENSLGSREDWPAGQEGITPLVVFMDKIESLEMPAEEGTAGQADRRAN